MVCFIGRATDDPRSCQPRRAGEIQTDEPRIARQYIPSPSGHGKRTARAPTYSRARLDDPLHILLVLLMMSRLYGGFCGARDMVLY